MSEGDSELFEFDVNGFVVLPAAIPRISIDSMLEFWDGNLKDDSVNDVDFSWSPEWRGLIDNEATFRVLDRLFSSRFRLDHMFCADERFVSSGGKMHHQANMFEDGIFYNVINGRIFNGLTGVLFSLTEMARDVTHFCCIPGSHRANFNVPRDLRDPGTSPLAKHIYLGSGDALIFSEALVHGTCVVEGMKRRRAVFARYTNAYSYYRRPPEHVRISALPATPNHSLGLPIAVDHSILTERQRRLVSEPAYARGKMPITPIEC